MKVNELWYEDLQWAAQEASAAVLPTYLLQEREDKWTPVVSPPKQGQGECTQPSPTNQTNSTWLH